MKENHHLYEESFADMEVDDRIAATMEDYEHHEHQNHQEGDTHPESSKRLEYYKQKAQSLSLEAVTALDKFADFASAGEEKITQEELDELREIAGDLIEVQNNSGTSDDKITINTGSSKTVISVKFDNDEIGL